MMAVLLALWLFQTAKYRTQQEHDSSFFLFKWKNNLEHEIYKYKAEELLLVGLLLNDKRPTIRNSKHLY